MNMPYVPSLQKQPRFNPLNLIYIIFAILILVLVMVRVARAEKINLPLANYKLNEFACKCCSQSKINIQLIMALENLREMANAPIIIISGYRCPKHNREIGGAKNSQHLYGNAVDIKIKGYTPTQVADMAKHCGFTYTKIYKSWCHLDIRQLK